jgi:hypothetical protein
VAKRVKAAIVKTEIVLKIGSSGIWSDASKY